MDDPRITPDMINSASRHGQLFLGALTRLVNAFFGANYKVTLVMSLEGKVDSLMVLSDVEETATMRAMLLRAAASSKSEGMIDASKPVTTH